MPTYSEYYNAASAVYNSGMTPSTGLKPFLDADGTPFIRTNADTGFAAAVYQTDSGQLIVAFQGTSNIAQINADTYLANGEQPPAFSDVQSFMSGLRDYTSGLDTPIPFGNIFVAGHSLGATESEYAMLTNPDLGGGAGFAPTGVPGYQTNPGAFANYTSYLFRGDTVSNDSSDSAAGSALGIINQDHVGNLVWFGQQTDQQTLIDAVTAVNSASRDVSFFALMSDRDYALGSLLSVEATAAAQFHPLSNYAPTFANLYSAVDQSNLAAAPDYVQSYFPGYAGGNPLSQTAPANMFDQEFSASNGTNQFSVNGPSGLATPSWLNSATTYGTSAATGQQASAGFSDQYNFNTIASTYNIPVPQQSQVTEISDANSTSTSSASTSSGYSFDSSAYTSNSFADLGDGGGDGGFGPVVLDLTGKGINITQLSSSNTYEDMTGDGYKNRTAWAGVGSGVLFVDTTGQGQLTQASGSGLLIARSFSPVSKWTIHV
jgi:hypothetical protein